MEQMGFMFSFALMMASPILLALLTVDVCSGILTRTMPQVSVYFLTLPIKIVLGLILLIFILPYINQGTTQLFTHCFNLWQGLIT